MPKRAMILLAVIALGVAIPACSNNNNTTTAPAPSVSFTPNPGITKATISVTISQTVAPFVPVQASTPSSNGSPRPGTPFATQKTNKKGITVFKGLKPSQTYCWVAILGPNQTSSTCTGWQIWQVETIPLGT